MAIGQTGQPGQPGPSGSKGRVVLFVAGRDPIEERAGGHSSYVRAHALAALRAGFEPHLFGVSRSRGAVETEYGVVHRLRTRLPERQMLIPLHGPRLARAVERFAATRPGPHVVHGFGLWGYAGVVAARRLRRRGTAATAVTGSYTTYAEETASKVRGVAAPHGGLVRVRHALELAWVRLALERYEREAYEGAGVVTVNYRSVAALLERRYRTRARTRRLPYAPPTAFASADTPPAYDEPAVPCVVSISRHEPRKGVDVLLRALATLRRDGVPFRALVASEGPLLEAHRRLATRLGLDDVVTLPGYVDSPPRLLRESQVFVLPSHREQSGSLSLLEALACGTAVVASGCDGILEDVTDGESALLVPPGDAGALAGALRRVLEDGALRARLRRAARRAHDARVGPEGFSAALRALYAGLGVVP